LDKFSEDQYNWRSITQNLIISNKLDRKTKRFKVEKGTILAKTILLKNKEKIKTKNRSIYSKVSIIEKVYPLNLPNHLDLNIQEFRGTDIQKKQKLNIQNKIIELHQIRSIGFI
jgi:hypothetical protein